MAKLFSKDYHEHSTSWFFNHAVIGLEAGDLLHWKYVDERDMIHLRFFAADSKKDIFQATVDISYDPVDQAIINHQCSDCRDEENCRHYLSVLRYAYFNLKTEIFDQPIVETCFGSALRASEELLVDLKTAFPILEGIYNPETDKIRFYYDRYADYDLSQIIRISLNEKPEGMSRKELEKANSFIPALSNAELRLWQFVYQARAAISHKNRFISIYKKDFPTALAYLKQLSQQAMIKESEERLIFAPQAYNLSLRIEPAGKKSYRLSAVIVDELSVWFAGMPTWLFFRNQVYTIELPLANEVIEAVFNGNMLLNAKDLIYFRTLVYHELREHNIYLDFDESIVLPELIDEKPRVKLSISKIAQSYRLAGSLSYSGGRELPLSVLRFRSPLIRLQDDSRDDTWFRIPLEITRQVEDLYRKLPGADLNRLEQYSELVFEDELLVERLKSVVFDLDEKDWDITISEDIERDFVHKARLEVEIIARQTDEIDWFTYDIRYRYKDLSFSHEELKQFFKTSEDFLHTKDGRTIFISNPELFRDMDKFIRKSEIKADKTYRARLMNLPYFQRYMQDNPQLRIMGDKFMDQMFLEILSRKLQREEALPHYLQAVLRGYQKAGYSWLLMLSRYRLNGILADEMGLGKTIQALSILAAAPEGSCSLVICPKTLLYNWAAEIEKFHTNISYLVVEGGKPERQELLATPNVQLFIMSYSLVLNEIDSLKERRFHWIVLDEAQNIKNVSAQRTSAIKKLKGEHRLALSGTPIENDLTELWSIMDFLLPGYLGTLNNFKKDYLHSDESQRNLEHLHRAVSPFILRRIKKDVLLELPDKQEQVSLCKLSPIQEKLYLQILDRVKKQLFPGEGKPEMNYIHILAALTKLRQTCNHPSLANSDISQDPSLSAKLEQLMELLHDSLQSGHKVLVFSQFVQMLKIIRTELDRQGLAYAYLDGQTKDRMQQVNRFNQDNSLKIFLISLKAGGTGLNLTAADTVILFDPWWNPMVEQQAIDRSHRMGQTSKVNVFRLITMGTVEEKIMRLQQSKRDLFTAIMEDGQQILKSMNSDDIKALFSYQ